MIPIGVELLSSVFAALIGALLPALRGLGGNVAVQAWVERHAVVRRAFRILGVEPPPTSDVKQIFQQLEKTSAEMDRVLESLTQLADERQRAVLKLETELAELTSREDELRTSISALESVSIPAADYFAKMVTQGEKSSARRDYALFLAGVLVSAAVSLIFRYLGWA